MGGEKHIAKQHASGRITVRECIDALCEKDSFLVRGILSGVRLC
jgi:acetyl-CoA carboxylase carboxyltransferase component